MIDNLKLSHTQIEENGKIINFSNNRDIYII